MPDEQDFTATWMGKILAADTYYNSWADKYKIDNLEEYYLGNQWKNQKDGPYTMNMFYATVETRLPSLIFDNPHYRIKPRSRSLQTDPEGSFEIAVNLEDTLNTWIDDEENHFADEVEACLYEFWFRFGIVETGYSADWIDNPRAGRPVLYSDNYRGRRNKNIMKQPEQIPVNERVYVRHIPADRFRVSIGSAKYLNQCDWCGYWEWVKLEDLRASRNIDTSDLEYAGGHDSSNDYSSRSIVVTEEYKDPDKKLEAIGGYIKIWKIWDNRAKMKYLFAETQEKCLFKKAFKFLPFEEIRYRKPKKGFYPFPPSYNWVSPQNEINEVREANREHRRRFRRFYQVPQGVDKNELSKVVNGPDGGMVEIPAGQKIDLIPNGDVGASASTSLVVSKDDFNVISGTAAEQIGQADRESATASNIKDRRAQIRESREKIIVANFLCRIGKKIIRTVKANFVNDITVSRQQPASEEQILSEIQPSVTETRTVNPLTDFGDDEFEFDVEIQIETVSPIAQQEELDKFMLFISLLQQYPIFAMSPILIRELAFRTGYKNEKVIQEFQRMSLLQSIGQVATGVDNLQQQGNPAAQQQVAQKTPPNNEQIRQQVTRQLQ